MSEDNNQKQAKWTLKQRAYIEWLALPYDLREQKSERAFAEHYGFSRESIWKWKHMPGLWDEVKNLSMQYFGSALPEVVESFKEQARHGSFNHQRTYFEMLGMYTPKGELSGPGGTPFILEIREHLHGSSSDTNTNTDEQAESVDAGQ